MRLRGRDQIHTRFVSAYRPCRNQGISTTWTQHLNYFRLKGDHVTNPRDKFDEDLCEEIKTWKELGDIIIIGIDMNEDAYGGKLSRLFRNLGLIPLIQSAHPNQSPPATFDGNQSRTTIEEIWGTQTVAVNRAGFMPFDNEAPSAPSDGHRMLWIEVDNNSILGKEVPHSSKSFDKTIFPSTDPRCQKSYGRLVRKEYSKKEIFKTHSKLARDVKSFQLKKIKNVSKFVQKFPKRFNSFESKTSNIKTAVGKKLRKIRAGKRPWSPKYKQITNTIDFWRRVKKMESRKKFKSKNNEKNCRRIRN